MAGIPEPFGIVPTGQKLITTPTEALSPTSFLYAIPPAAQLTNKSFSHIAVFLLPNVTLPPGMAAAIYLVTPPTAPGQTEPNSKFLGGIGEGKESALFKLNTKTASNTTAASGTATTTTPNNVVIGISLEPADSVLARISELSSSSATSSSSSAPTSTALVPVPGQGQGQRQGQGQPSTLVLAQRIIKNAFNFLSSFSGRAGEVEVVPLKAFEEWWRKFETRVRNDPGFLERDD